MSASDILPFFQAWLSAPLRVASITPSGQALADLITSEISATTGPVLELGVGTGVFTRALLARGVLESNLTLVENGPEFALLLDQRFPKARVLTMDAARLRRCDQLESTSLGAVVSGLPLLSMRPRKVISILAGAFTHLKPGGSFYQFTYGPRCPVPRPLLDRLDLKATRIGGTYCNLPPAAVYRISRRAPFPTGNP
ncbi:methyltransferase domain-containing protein [Methylocella sp. CPCC 101449]|jgi:phospholipid N-methyltransferase|uniref:class I SAM-dependent methyltransferase n=1 Tax=Methylocella sp. CPCC 101449 TaxID=2987531 RepID=UPI002891C7BC|nr:methyltransferase domain-containing protein [Methylocella sp. CPCC 101449]MDT2019614.1 methyltransferase domain-containing protein [Methylocella sp. CPCC 101449]